MIPYLAIIIWPVVTAVIFAFSRPQVAIIVSILLGYLLLPPFFGINFPLLPTFDKTSIPVLSALLFASITISRMPPDEVRPGWLPRGAVARVLLLLLFVGPFLTAATNGDVIVRGSRVSPSVNLYDAFSLLLVMLVTLVPFVLARKFLATAQSHRLILVSLAVIGVAYSLLALFEVRMSPQLNRWVYGYFPHSWVQHIRGDGFRPLVFMTHALVLAIFMAMAFLAALGAIRSIRNDSRALWILSAIWLLATLFLIKSLGPLMVAVALAPVVLLLGRRAQIMTVAVLAGMILTYPMLRGTNLAPVQTVLTVAEKIDPDRARSFRFRVDNEEILLARAQERPLFGWGGFARSRVYDEFGRDLTITDGYWVIVIGQGGWVRYVGEFGLLLLPVIFLAFRFRRYDVGPETAAITVVLVANGIDLIPNAGIQPLTWLLAGALWGRQELGHVTSEDRPTQMPQGDTSPLGHGLRAGGKPTSGRAAGGLYARRASETHDRPGHAYTRFGGSKGT